MDNDTIEIIEFSVAEAKCTCGWTEKASTVENAILLSTEHRHEHDEPVVVKYRKAHRDEQWYVAPR